VEAGILKRILVYMVAAVLLGIVTMAAPYELLMSKRNEETSRFMTTRERATAETLSEGTKQPPGLVDEEATLAIRPLDIPFLTFMLLFSLIVALGVTLYFKKRMLRASLS
jgi:hypothetical protein